MTPQRPKSITVSSILNFVFGGLGIIFALTGIVNSSSMMSNPLNAMANNLPPEVAQMAGTYGVLIGFLSLAVGGVAIVSGIGLMQMARWGRGWTFGYAIAGIANCIIAFLIMLLITAATLAKIHPNNGADPNKAFSIVIAGAAFVGLAKCTYPVVLLFFLRSPKWKEAFATNSTGNA